MKKKHPVYCITMLNMDHVEGNGTSTTFELSRHKWRQPDHRRRDDGSFQVNTYFSIPLALMLQGHGQHDVRF